VGEVKKGTNIVNQAGIAKGSFYQYFQDKKDLYFHLLDLVGQAKMRYMGVRMQGTPRNFFEMFRDMIVLGAEFAIAHPVYNTFGTMVMENPNRDETLTRLKSMAAEAYAGMIKQGQDAGDIRTDVPVDILVMFINNISVDFGKHIIEKAELQFADLVTEENLVKLDVRGIAEDLLEVLQSGMKATQKGGESNGNMG
jgi:AcrR family transcriptional regulator